MIDQNQRRQIRGLLQSPQWASVDRLATEYINRIKDEELLPYSEWDALNSSLSKEYRIRGIRGFLQEVYSILQDTDESK